MMQSSNMFALAVCLCTGVVISCASRTGTTLAPENLDLSGSWFLNTQLSDDPREMREGGGMPGGMVGGRPLGGIGDGRPPGGMGGRGSMGGRAPSSADMRRMEQTMRQATEAPRRIVLEQHDSTVTIRNVDGRTLMVHTNWKKVTQEVADGVRLDIRAQWHGTELHVEHDVQGGGKVLRKYYLSPDTGRLHVQSHFELGRGGQERDLHYVYDPGQNQN